MRDNLLHPRLGNDMERLLDIVVLEVESEMVYDGMMHTGLIYLGKLKAAPNHITSTWEACDLI